MLRAPYTMQSRTRRTDGRIGKIHSFWATYSLRMSAWMVPDSAFRSLPRRLANAMYIAYSTQALGLMVIDTEILVRSMPSNSASMSSMVSTATPSRPTSPWLIGWSES